MACRLWRRAELITAALMLLAGKNEEKTDFLLLLRISYVTYTCLCQDSASECEISLPSVKFDDECAGTQAV